MQVVFGPEDSGRLQFQWANRIPSLVSKAARDGGYESNAHYLRIAILNAVARDLGLDAEELIGEQPSKADHTARRSRHVGYGPYLTTRDVT